MKSVNKIVGGLASCILGSAIAATPIGCASEPEMLPPGQAVRTMPIYADGSGRKAERILFEFDRSDRRYLSSLNMYCIIDGLTEVPQVSFNFDSLIGEARLSEPKDIRGARYVIVGRYPQGSPSIPSSGENDCQIVSKGRFR